MTRCPEINLDVYELWIDYFRDSATSKPWTVCINDDIAYAAIASSDCTNWDWDMEDGLPDAWNPEGGDEQSGIGMRIPNSDKARASNSWFGDAYGTVNVFCEDGEGINYRFYSTSMSPPQKAQVFFDPDTAKDGSNPLASTTMPPAWFVFWKDGDVVEGMSACEYQYRPNTYGFAKDGSVTLCNKAPTENGPVQTLTIPVALRTPGGPSTFEICGTGKYLDCIAETLFHENHHIFITSISVAGSDTDEINDAEETTPSESYFPASDPTNPDTFGFANTARLKQVYGANADNEVRCRILERQTSLLPATHPERNWARDPRNPKW